MICLGRSNYFRFNHPQEAEMLRDPNYNYRISNIVPNFMPGQSLITKSTVTITFYMLYLLQSSYWGQVWRHSPVNAPCGPHQTHMARYASAPDYHDMSLLSLNATISGHFSRILFQTISPDYHFNSLLRGKSSGHYFGLNF
ncbi:pleckstriny-like domain family B member 1 isoform X7 [Biomphalaria glabrata]|nr:pleckstrin homology-like domain family B member 1 [Biomphalaria glabrata]